MASRQLAQASVTNWDAKDLELQASLTPEERQHCGTYVLLYNFSSGAMDVLSEDDLLKSNDTYPAGPDSRNNGLD
jgi:hypothetical protein